VNLGDVSVVTEKDGNGVLLKIGSESLVRQTTWIRQRRFEVIRYTVDTLILDLLLKLFESVAGDSHFFTPSKK
jgi:hypothetical protein